jgi:hypothetical protein
VPFIFLDVARALWKLRRDTSFVSLTLLVVGLLLGGTGFYVRFEHMGGVDAFYLSVITLTTVGYGDVAPVTAGGKIFTAVFVLVGMGILVAFLTTIASHIRRDSIFQKTLDRLAAHHDAHRPPDRARAARSVEAPSGTALSSLRDYDLLVVGSDEASRRTAIEAAGAGLRVVVVDSGDLLPDRNAA